MIVPDHRTHPWIWAIMFAVSTGLDLPCPVAFGTMLCRLIAGVSAFARHINHKMEKDVEANYFRQSKISQLKRSFGWDNVFAKLAPNHCLKQWWSSCWHGYASNGHNELVTLFTHWGRVTHISVSKLIIISSDDGLSPDRRQGIIWTNARKLLFGPPGTNFSEILIQIHTFSFNKMHLKWCHFWTCIPDTWLTSQI